MGRRWNSRNNQQNTVAPDANASPVAAIIPPLKGNTAIKSAPGPQNISVAVYIAQPPETIETTNDEPKAASFSQTLNGRPAAWTYCALSTTTRTNAGPTNTNATTPQIGQAAVNANHIANTVTSNIIELRLNDQGLGEGEEEGVSSICPLSMCRRPRLTWIAHGHTSPTRKRLNNNKL